MDPDGVRHCLVPDCEFPARDVPGSEEDLRPNVRAETADGILEVRITAHEPPDLPLCEMHARRLATHAVAALGTGAARSALDATKQQLQDWGWPPPTPGQRPGLS